MPICREGHHSATEDYCDECGAPIAAAAAGGPGAAAAGAPAGTGAPAGEVCPVCGAPRSGRFCEEDGYDFVLRPPVSPATAAPEAVTPQATDPPALVAVITADRDYYETVMSQHGPDSAKITFPVVDPERRIRLAGDQVVIGRRSTSRGLNPEIDLAGPPEDPGVSHVHAVLRPATGGGWTITDPGSTNGTTINDDPEPIEANVPVPIRSGDRVHVGAWTTITFESAT